MALFYGLVKPKSKDFSLKFKYSEVSLGFGNILLKSTCSTISFSSCSIVNKEVCVPFYSTFSLKKVQSNFKVTLPRFNFITGHDFSTVKEIFKNFF